MYWYRLLLWLYPASFRSEYGEEMCALYATSLRRTPGRSGRVFLALAALGDIVPNALAVHADMLRQDLRYTARTLRRSWGFALTVVLILALGVGANTAAFSVADFVLIRPLPFPQPDRLVRIWSRTPGYGQMEFSPANYRDFQGMNRSLASMGAYVTSAANLVADGEPQRLQGARATAELLPLMGVQPLLGRFPAADASLGSETRSLALSYALWQGRFGGVPDILGRRVNLDGEPYVVVGVMPKDFLFPHREVQFWTPLEFTEQDFADRGDNYLEVVARLREGVPAEQARVDLTRVAAQLEQQYPVENERTGITLYVLSKGLAEKSKLLLLALCGAAVCILMLACANLANLLLARASAREHELAVRNALGAGRERLVRQLITESVVLALLGGTAGVLIALAAVPLLGSLVPTTLPIAQQPGVDVRVLLIAALFTVFTGLGFGVLPAWRAGGASGLRTLREGARAVGRGQRLRGVLVSVQVTASVVLVVASGLLIRALWRVQQVDPGFRTENVLTLRTALPLPGYDSVARRDEFYGRVLAAVRALPGVTHAAYTTGLPMVMTGGIWPVALTGQAELRDASNTASLRFLTPGFFATLDIPLRAGRDLRESDRRDHPLVAVVSESFARRYWPVQNAIGKHFQFAFAEREIVGVVGDIRVRGLERQSEPQVYLPHSQMRDGQSTWYAPKDLLIRTTLPVATFVPRIRDIVQAVDPAQPLSDMRLLSRIVARETGSRVAQLRILGTLSAIALLLAAVGIHGLLSFTVARRAREIGVRLALGARPNSVLRMVVREGLLMALAGLVPGLLLSYVAGRAMNTLLFGVQAMDPPTLILAIGMTLTMTLLGSLLPALRAVRTDPLSVMRAE